MVVATPLDMITQLEEHGGEIGTVVLDGGFAANRDLATFLLECYPAVRIVDGQRELEPDTYLPAFG